MPVPDRGLGGLRHCLRNPSLAFFRGAPAEPDARYTYRSSPILLSMYNYVLRSVDYTKNYGLRSIVRITHFFEQYYLVPRYLPRPISYLISICVRRSLPGSQVAGEISPFRNVSAKLQEAGPKQAVLLSGSNRYFCAIVSGQTTPYSHSDHIWSFGLYRRWQPW